MATRQQKLKLNDEMLEAMASEYLGEAPEGAGPKQLDLKWRPKLNPVQTLVYDCQSEYILSYGPRASGKTLGGLHKLVHHCVHNRNAFALIIVKEMGQAADGGAWEKLVLEVLPAWKEGNYDRKTQKRIDNGVGIEHTEPHYDANTKKPYIWISNKFGGWSKVMLISLFVGEHVGGKVKGKEASFVLLDEAQTTDSDEYFTKLGQQVGRRQGIDGKQQIVYCANPAGQKHWLFQTFFMHMASDEDEFPVQFGIDDETGHPVNPITDKPIEAFSVFHVPISENSHNLPPGYWERVQQACKNDPIEHARMVLGQWVDQPDGESMFHDEFDETLHMLGDVTRNKGLHPMPGHPVIISYDPGGPNTSVHFEQVIPEPDKITWLVFDELNYVGRYMPYSKLVPKLIERMKYWEEKAGKEFAYRHISDDSAFNQFRARDGSFDAADIEKISKDYVEKNKLPERFIIRMEACPKGPHSVAARVRLVKDMLIERSVFISAMCPRTREMFMHLEEDRDDRLKPKRSRHIHPFDSLSYGPFFFSQGRGQSQVVLQSLPAKEFFVIGKN